MDKKKNINKTEEKITKLSQHKRFKKELVPPLLQLPKLNHSSWIDDRLPELLWIALIIGNFEREKALDFFRYVGNYVLDNKEFADITHSALGNLPDEKLKKFIKYLISYSKEIKLTLQVLCYYPEIPKFKIWKQILGVSKSKEKVCKLYKAIIKTYYHQSQEATDCRWVKILCLVLGGRLKLLNENETRKILEYPNFGDMERVRPSIRATEIVFTPKDINWSKNFWKRSYKSFECVPEEMNSKKVKKLQDDFELQIKKRREHYIEESKNVRNELIKHFLKVIESSGLDIRKESTFGLTFYAWGLFTEINFYNCSHSLVGRIALRSLIELHISFEYLLKQEKIEPNIWDSFYAYGKGQAKLIYLKYKERGFNSSSVDLEEIDGLLNEDKWLEFIPINLGHWDTTNLRQMSEMAGTKDIYDKYYDYTSGYVHGTSLAIRESIYQRCLNPLHRFHRIPTFDLPLRPTTIPDSIEIINKILDCMNKAYPSIKNRITLYKKTKKSK